MRNDLVGGNGGTFYFDDLESAARRAKAAAGDKDVVVCTASILQQCLNAGLMENTGVEALVTVTPVRTGSFDWSSTFNFAKNNNEVVRLAEGVNRILLGGGLFGEMRLEARPGQPYGAIWGYGHERDEATGLPLIQDGIPIGTDTMIYLGSIQPDWTGGWNNQFTFKNMSLNVLFDIRRGGSLMSYTNLVGEYSGVLESSLRGREIEWDNPGYVARGIDVDTGEPNEVAVNSEVYFQSAYIGGLAEPYVYDASYVKLREIRFGFDVPQRFASRLNAESVSLALTGRNLALWTDVPNIDPEFAYSSGNVQGMEYAIPANTRSFGLSVRITP